MFASLKALALGALAATTVPETVTAAMYQLDFAGTYDFDYGMQPLPLPDLANFVSGRIVYDTSVPIVEDSNHIGPIFRQFGAVHSFDLVLWDILAHPIGAASATPGHPDDQATVLAYATAPTAYFRTFAMNFAPFTEAILVLSFGSGDLAETGVQQLNQTMLVDQLSARPDSFQLQLFAAGAGHVYQISAVSLETVTPPAVPLPAGLPLLVSALGVFALNGRRKRSVLVAAALRKTGFGRLRRLDFRVD